MGKIIFPAIINDGLFVCAELIGEITLGCLAEDPDLVLNGTEGGIALASCWRCSSRLAKRTQHLREMQVRLRFGLHLPTSQSSVGLGVKPEWVRCGEQWSVYAVNEPLALRRGSLSKLQREMGEALLRRRN